MDVLIRPARRAEPGEIATASVRPAPAGVVIVAAFASGVWVAVQLLRRDDALGTPAYDQAFFQQLVWNLDHGRWFVSSFNPNSFLGLHFSPLLVLAAGLELIWPDPRMLTLLNAAGVALVAPAGFLLLRAAFAPFHLGVYLAGGLAAALPFTPTMQEAARAGFHPETLALPAALAAGWAGLSQRPRTMWALAAVPLLAKEDQVYAVAVVGLLVAVLGGPRMRPHGWMLCAAAVTWGLALFTLIMPALRGGAGGDIAGYYGWLAAGPNASAVWAQVTHREGWAAAAALIFCLCCLPLLRPAWMLLVFPPLLADLLSHHHPQPDLQLQYGLPLVVPAIAATAMGGRTALTLLERHLPSKLGPAVAAAAVPGLLLGALWGSLPPAAQSSAAFERQPGLARLAAIAAIIPPDAPVAADNGAAAPLGSRTKIYVLPNLYPDCYVVVDRVAPVQSFMTAEKRAALLAELPTNRRPLADDGRFQVWSPVGG
jgi:uncharacterized membrane protein